MKFPAIKSIAVSAIILLSAVSLSAHEGHTHAPTVKVPESDINLNTPWAGKRVAYLGDSMTDPKNKSTKNHHWNYLETLMGIEPHVFARSGYKWDGIYKKAEEMNAALGDSIDAIMIWAGTNDYNHGIPSESFSQRRLTVSTTTAVWSCADTASFR